MSIYQPVSTVTRRALGVGGSILNGVAGQISTNLGANLGNGLSGRLAQTALNAGTNLAVSEITRRVTNPLMDFAQQADNRLKSVARKGLQVFGLNGFDDENISRNALHYSGNLSILQAWENYKLSNVDSLSRKNFYLLEVNDRSGNAPTSNGKRHSQFNLWCTNLSFTSFDIQGEAIQVGAIELDKPTANAKTVMNLTMFDDEFGTIKRWAQNKASMIAASDGTFMPPAYYVFEVRVVFGTNIAHSSYYEQIYTMRVQTMPHELSRTEQGLEELQLTFSQVDTFMPSWI